MQKCRLRRASAIAVLACVSHGSAAELAEAVHIRAFVPYEERLANEMPHRLIVRIENRSKAAIPLMSSWNDDGGGLEQIRYVIEADAQKGGAGDFADWGEISNRADYFVRPGEACELISGSMSGLGLPGVGVGRFVLQVGPDEMVYSNWVTTQTVEARESAGWPVLGTFQMTPGEVGLQEFVIGSTPSGNWVFQRPVWDRSRIMRICSIPGDKTPEIMGDELRRQAEIVFPGHPEQSVFFSGVLGLSRKQQWPVGHVGGDFVARSLAVDAPSPLEFPLELFPGREKGEREETDSRKSSRSSQLASDNAESDRASRNYEGQEAEPKGNRFTFAWVGGGIVLVLVALFYYVRGRKVRKDHR
jgi:hypothetical protein